MEDITKMKRRDGESEEEFWLRKVTADPDVIVTERTVTVLHRPGETREEYSDRLHAARPPFSERQKATLRAAGAEYWAIVREQRRKPE